MIPLKKLKGGRKWRRQKQCVPFPFKVEQDIQLFELMRSIEDKGVLVPLLVRSNPYGDGYEIIAGHRRKAACAWTGIEEVLVIIRELDDKMQVYDDFLKEYDYRKKIKGMQRPEQKQKTVKKNREYSR